MRRLSTLDAQFLGVESARTFTHFSVLGTYDPSTAPGGAVTLADLRRRVEERLHLLPPFRWRLVEVPLGLDLPYWADDPDFDLGFHIREAAVPPPGDDRQVAETVARIVARPLDRSRPLWELYLLHGLRDGRIGVLTKVHHSAADGVSGNELLTALLDRAPDGGRCAVSRRQADRGRTRAGRARDARPRARQRAAPSAAHARPAAASPADAARGAGRERLPRDGPAAIARLGAATRGSSRWRPRGRRARASTGRSRSTGASRSGRCRSTE